MAPFLKLQIRQHRKSIRQHDYYSRNDGDSHYGRLKLENFISSSRLTHQDSDFLDRVESDIRGFLDNVSSKRVLVFPPFNNFRRYLVHQIVQTHFDELKTFSIGEGENRRTVVCFDKDYKYTTSFYSSNGCLPVNGTTEVDLSQFPVESVCDSGLENRKRVKRARTMPSVSIYRPPAARKLEQATNLSNNHPRESVGTSTPGKSKFKTSEEPKEINQPGKRTENDGMSVFRSAVSSVQTQNNVPKCKNVENGGKKVEVGFKVTKPEETLKNTSHNKQRRPDIQVYVPKGRRSVSANNDIKKPSSPVREKKSYKDGEVLSVADKNSFQIDSVETEKKISKEKEAVDCAEVKAVQPKVTLEDVQDKSSTQTDFKESSCSENNEKKGLSSVKVINFKSENISEDKNLKKENTGHLNPEEDDWEAMYDDTGECLDPSLLDQLTSAVGEVTIEKPKSSYNGYKTKSLDTVADEFPHVIEIYNFPPEFQLQDLMMVFSQFKNSGFEIKWVDDTHALGIFSSSAIVSEVLDFYHPFVKTRSLKDGTLLSKMKARRSAEFLLPYKPRPETCSALARRLVTGALGVRLPTSRQEREAEKQILTKARERKRLEAKQKEDAWEGTFS